jgi:glycosyltransferase involved in cell wall biosynthesis
MKNIALLEMSSGGHHPRYMRWVLESGILQRAQITVIAPQALLDHTELRSLRDFFIGVAIHLTPAEEKGLRDFSFVGLLRREFIVRNIYRRVFAKQHFARPFDVVFLPYVDDCVHAFGLLGSPFAETPWFGINMTASFHFRSMGILAPSTRLRKIREWLYRRVLIQESLGVMLSIDPTLIEFAASQSAPEFRKLVYLPDPSPLHSLPQKAEARRNLSIPADAYVILAYGALSERKGVISLLEAASNSRCPSQIHLLLAGAQEEVIVRILEGPVGVLLREQGRLHVWAGYVPSNMEGLMLAASDCMWLGYKDFFMMSSILAMAGMHGLPSLISKAGIIGHLQNKYRLGATVEDDSAEAVVKAITEIYRSDNDLKLAGARAREVFGTHTLEAFNEIIVPIASSLLLKNVPSHD